MENQEPIGGLMSSYGAALAVLLWTLAGGLYLGVIANECIGEACVAQPISQRTADLTSFAFITLAVVVAFLATLGSALGTIVEAGRNRDWLSLSALLVIFALFLVALYALTLDGHLEQTFLGGLYGFSPGGFSTHPFAYGATIALVVLPAPAALAYHLLHERARRASSLVSLAWMVGAVGLLVAICLAPAVPLPT
jgi:hypothetical protein